jgi:uncharacterized protein (TIGR02246 family)
MATLDQRIPRGPGRAGARVTQRFLRAVAAALTLASAGCAQVAAPPAGEPAQPPPAAPPVAAAPPAALPVAAPAPAPAPEPPSVAEQWAAAFSKGDLDALMSLYDDDAQLWGTSSSQMRRGTRAIRQYYAQLMKAFPGTRVALRETNPRRYGEAGVNSGLYTMRRVTSDGKVVVTSARFTMTYVWRDGKWLIVDQHSSLAAR